MLKASIKDFEMEILLGVYEQERHNKQKIIINIEYEYDEGDAPKTDKVSDTIDYHVIVEKIRESVANTQYELLEALVEHISNIVMENKRIFQAKIEVDKPDAPIDGLRSVSITKICSNN